MATVASHSKYNLVKKVHGMCGLVREACKGVETNDLFSITLLRKLLCNLIMHIHFITCKIVFNAQFTKNSQNQSHNAPWLFTKVISLFTATEGE